MYNTCVPAVSGARGDDCDLRLYYLNIQWLKSYIIMISSLNFFSAVVLVR